MNNSVRLIEQSGVMGHVEGPHAACALESSDWTQASSLLEQLDSALNTFDRILTELEGERT